MSEGGYKITNKEGIHFLTFAVVEWVDVFSKLASVCNACMSVQNPDQGWSGFIFKVRKRKLCGFVDLPYAKGVLPVRRPGKIAGVGRQTRRSIILPSVFAYFLGDAKSRGHPA